MANACVADHAALDGRVVVLPDWPSGVIASMGSKIEARLLAERAGVPVVPGETPEDQTDDGVRRAIERIGLPALIKASAGASEFLPIAKVTNLAQFIEQLKRRSVWVAGIEQSGKLKYTGYDYSGPHALVFGGEYRKMHSQFIPDTALSSGDVVGFNAAGLSDGAS